MLLVVYFFTWLFRKQVQHVLTSVVLCLLALVAGGWAHHLQWRVFPADELGRQTAAKREPAVLRGIVAQSVRNLSPPPFCPMDRVTTGVRTRFLVAANAIRNGNQWTPVSGRVMVTVSGEINALNVGDEVELKGFISRPPSARSRNDFDLALHYRYQRILRVMFVPSDAGVVPTGRIESGYYFGRRLDLWGQKIRSVIHRTFSERTANLVAAMMLGDRHRVDNSLQRQFLATGTMHLLAISGLHVGILSFGVLSLAKTGWVSRQQGYWITIVFVVSYCLLTGAQPPVSRATFLVALFCAGKIWGKEPVSVNSLSLAAIVVLCRNPTAVFQTGTQLSFVAVATLILLSESDSDRRQSGQDTLSLFLRRKRGYWKRNWDGIVNYVCNLFMASLAVWLTTIPLVAKSFHLVAPIGILANVILMVPVTLFLYLGLVSVLLALAGCLAGVEKFAEYLSEVVVGTISIAAEIPWGHWWSFGLETFWLILFYLGFCILFLQSRWRLQLRWQIGLFCIWSAVALGITQLNSVNRDRLAVTFIDVGHGTSVLIELPDGQNLLYDAGSLSSSGMAAGRISAVLWEKKIGRLDALVLSHADLDHYNAVPELARRFELGRVFVSDKMFSSPLSPSLEELSRQLQVKHIKVAQIRCGDTIEMDSDCRIRVEHPDPEFRGKSDNANSLVLRIDYQNQSILLTGDLENEGLEALLANEETGIDILMAPHHGSSATNHEKLARWCKPAFVVISNSAKSNSDGVADLYRRFGARTLATSRNGMITLELTRDDVRLSTWIE